MTMEDIEPGTTTTTTTTTSHETVVQEEIIPPSQQRLPLTTHDTKILNWTGSSPAQQRKKSVALATRGSESLINSGIAVPSLLDCNRSSSEVRLHTLTNFSKKQQRRISKTISSSAKNIQKRIHTILYAVVWILLTTIAIGVYYHYIHTRVNTLRPFWMKMHLTPSTMRRMDVIAIKQKRQPAAPAPPPKVYGD